MIPCFLISILQLIAKQNPSQFFMLACHIQTVKHDQNAVYKQITENFAGIFNQNLKRINTDQINTSPLHV